MAPRNPPLWLQAGTYSSQTDRILLSMITERTMSTTGALVTQSAGVWGPVDQLKVLAQAGNTLGWNATSGIAIIVSPDQEPPGAYVCYNEGYGVGICDAASSSPRFDRIIARVRDQYTGAAVGTNDWVLDVVKGQESSSPVVPALPAYSIPLAHILIKPASQNAGYNRIQQADIIDERRFVTSQGGVHMIYDNRPFPAHSPGRMVYDFGEKSMFFSNGTQWLKITTTVSTAH